MKSAVYARKSNDHEAGVSRQVELARDFITGRGWTLDPAHVFTDNDVSGATFDRPGLNALLAATDQKPLPFTVLVTMNVDRLSRGTIAETLALQQRIIQSGVAVWFYQTGAHVDLSTATDELKGAIDAFGARNFRDEIRVKTKQALHKKAAGGHVTSSRIYGYDIVRTGDDSDFVINPIEAALVERMLDLYADGWGFQRIASRFNEERIPSPRSTHVCKFDEDGRRVCKHRGSYTGWPASTLKAWLGQTLYRGTLTYANRETPLPHLKIGSDELWARVEARSRSSRQHVSAIRAQAAKAASVGPFQAKHLLAGLLECGGCGGHLVATSRSDLEKKVRRYYVCSRRYKLGLPCSSRTYVPYAGITQAVLSHFQPGELDRLVQAEWLNTPTPQWALDACQTEERLQGDVKRLEREVSNLTEAIKHGGNLRSLVEALTDAETLLEAAQARLVELASPEPELTEEDLRQLEAEMRWLDAQPWTPVTILNNPQEGRRVLRKLLTRPIRVTEAVEGRRALGWDYVGEGDLAGLIQGRVTSGQYSSARCRAGPPRSSARARRRG
jgi:site-specific DNA recombinase